MNRHHGHVKANFTTKCTDFAGNRQASYATVCSVGAEYRNQIVKSSLPTKHCINLKYWLSNKKTALIFRKQFFAIEFDSRRFRVRIETNLFAIWRFSSVILREKSIRLVRWRCPFRFLFFSGYCWILLITISRLTKKERPAKNRLANSPLIGTSPYLPTVELHSEACNNWLVHGRNALAHWPPHMFDSIVRSLDRHQNYFLHVSGYLYQSWIYAGVCGCNRSANEFYAILIKFQCNQYQCNIFEGIPIHHCCFQVARLSLLLHSLVACLHFECIYDVNLIYAEKWIRFNAT